LLAKRSTVSAAATRPPRQIPRPNRERLVPPAPSAGPRSIASGH
jgi:hypothetical protein